MRARYDPVVKPLMTCWPRTSSAVMAVQPSACRPPQALPSSFTLHGRADTLRVDEFTVFDGPAYHVRTVRIAVLVKAKFASHALKIAGLAHCLHDGRTVFLASALDGIQRDNGRLVGIHRPTNRL